MKPKYASEAELEAFLEAVYMDRPPPRAILCALADFVEDVLYEQTNPQRKAFGLPVKRGTRPSQVKKHQLVVTYVLLALHYGHTLNRPVGEDGALGLARGNFGYANNRAIEKILQTYKVKYDKAHSYPKTWAARLTNAGYRLPPRPYFTG